MSGRISAPKKYAVRNFLLRCVRESSPDLLCRLMTEQALCEKFQVNRETVRNAISDLEFSSIVKRIPGKKGIYANPSFSRFRKKLIGLVNGSPVEPYHHYFQNSLLARLTLELENKFSFLYQYPVLSDDISIAGEQLGMYSFDAILYFHFTSQYNNWLGCMGSLLEEGHPLIIVSNATNDPLPERLPFNMIGIDQELFAKRQLDFLLQNAAPSMLIFGQKNACFQYLEKELKKRGGPLQLKGIRYDDELDKAEFISLLEKKKIRSIYCASGFQIIRPILEVLASDPGKYSSVTFYCAAIGEAAMLKTEFPGTNIVLSPELHVAPERVCKVVLEKLEEMLLQGKNRFESVFLS